MGNKKGMIGIHFCAARPRYNGIERNGWWKKTSLGGKKRNRISEFTFDGRNYDRHEETHVMTFHSLKLQAWRGKILIVGI